MVIQIVRNARISDLAPRSTIITIVAGAMGVHILILGTESPGKSGDPANGG
jgi:hypothetical protein